MGEQVATDSLPAQRRAATRILQLTLAAVSLVTLIMGLAISWFAASLGLSPDIVNMAAFGMLLTAIAHALALYLWDQR